MWRKVIVVAVVIAIAAGAWTIWLATSSDADAGRELGQIWPVGGRISVDEVDHSAWDALLRRYVNDDGLVDYRGWQASAADTAQLRDYLAQLSRADPTRDATRDAKLAFWINAYNAVTVAGILQLYPTTSIRNYTGLVGYNIWDDLLLRVGNETFSLNAMEHDILRKLGEPRIHFAIVCASIGCPRLLNEAYVADRMEEQLATNARHFFAQPQNLRIDPAANTIYLSSILKWFAADFGATLPQQLATISPYFPDEASRELAAYGGVDVRYLDYDWNLNEQK